jgi:hypothetical protein
MLIAYATTSDGIHPTNTLLPTHGRQNALPFAILFGKKELVKATLSRIADMTPEMFSLRTELERKGPRELASAWA